MTDGSVGAFFIYFSQFSMFLNGRGRASFFTNLLKKIKKK